MTPSDSFRHIDTFDHLRIQVVIVVLTKLLQGSTQPIHELLRSQYEWWERNEGVRLRPTEDMTEPEDALSECWALIAITDAMYSDGHWIDAPEECASVAVASSGTPRYTWIGFCEGCRTTHMVTGREPDPAYDGSLPIPCIPQRRPRSRRSHL